jgi:magnesium-transporting ATPase (P-type)
MNEEILQKVRSMVAEYSLKGFRVIAVAQKTNPSSGWFLRRGR